MPNKDITAKDAKIVKNVYKDDEYIEFMRLVNNGELPDTWELTAEAIGVHPNTIKAWRKLPEFREAKRKGIEHCLAEMRRAGKEDWRQWEASLRLLGVKTSDQPTTNIQINIKPILGGQAVSSNDSDTQVIEAQEAD